jgi:predicted dinucleotide-binding enzyme
MEHVAIIGAGSGGKAAAADLILQGKKSTCSSSRNIKRI